MWHSSEGEFTAEGKQCSRPGCCSWDASVIEAILLVGGQGTRLRPLTATTPKPMLPVAGQPITVHQIRRARAAGVGRVVLGTSYRADVFTRALGDGADLGIDVAYAHETTPLGTGGAIRNAAEELNCGPNDPVVVFNGDIINGLDIAALVDGHVSSGSAVTLHLTTVEDPRRYGLVPTDETGRVLTFLEKPETEAEIVTNQINAGCYVFRRSVIDRIALGRPVSVERETFPGLLRDGDLVRGVVDDSYWLDLGTPWDYVQGSVDLVTGRAPGAQIPSSAQIRGGQSLVLDGANVSPEATLSGGTTIDRGCVVAADAIVDGCVVMTNVHIGQGARLFRSAVGAGAKIEAGAVITEAVVGDGARIGRDAVIGAGARIGVGAVVPDGITVTANSD